MPRKPWSRLCDRSQSAMGLGYRSFARHPLGPIVLVRPRSDEEVNR